MSERGAAIARPRGAMGAILGLLLLLAYAAFRLSDFLAPGLPLLIDAHSHVARAGFAAEQLANGHYPDWSFYWYGGYRLLSFYGPLYHSLTGALGLALGDVVAATKAVVFGGQLAVVALLFALLRRLDCGPAAAAFGAVVFLESIERAVVVGGLASYPVLGIWVAVPLLLWLVVRGAGPPLLAARLFAGQALVLAGMLLANLGNGLLALPAWLAFAGVHLFGVVRPADRLRALVALGLAPLAALALAGFGVFDAWVRLDGVTLSLERLSFSPAYGVEALVTLVGAREASFERVWVQPVEPVAGLLALVGVALALLRAGASLRPAAAALGVVIAILVCLEDRVAVLVPLLVGVLAGQAVDLLGRRTAERGLAPARHGLPLLAMALLIVTAPARGPLEYAPADALAVYERLPDDGSPGRSLDVTPGWAGIDGFYGPSSLAPWFSGRAVPFGAYPQGAPLATGGLLALSGSIVADLARRPPRLSERSLDTLLLAHVEVLVDRDEDPRLQRLRLPRGARRSEPGVLLLPDASPALFAPRTAPPPLPAAGGGSPVTALLAPGWAEAARTRGGRMRSLSPLLRAASQPSDWDGLAPLLSEMRIDRAGATASVLFVDTPLPVEAVAPVGAFEVLRHEESLDGVVIEARAGGPGALRLAYSWDPDLRVSLDGRPVETTRGSLAGAVVMRLPAGRHVVELKRPESSTRSWLLAGSGIGILLLAAVCVARPRLTVPRDA